MIPADSTDLEGQLRSAAQELMRTLAAGQNGAAWMAYLEPHRISQLVDRGDSAALSELLTRYDGLIGNPQRKVIVAASGFAHNEKLAETIRQPNDGIERATCGRTNGRVIAAARTESGPRVTAVG